MKRLICWFRGHRMRVYAGKDEAYFYCGRCLRSTVGKPE